MLQYCYIHLDLKTSLRDWMWGTNIFRSYICVPLCYICQIIKQYSSFKIRSHTHLSLKQNKTNKKQNNKQRQNLSVFSDCRLINTVNYSKPGALLKEKCHHAVSLLLVLSSPLPSVCSVNFQLVPVLILLTMWPHQHQNKWGLKCMAETRIK